MELFTCTTVRTLFKCLCLVTTIFMVGYWFYKFGIKDEDLCLVDYVALEKTKNNELPVVSICIKNPVLDEKLKQIHENINSSMYIAYLLGEIYDERFADIDYNNVTFNLSDYVRHSYTRLRSGRTIYTNTTSNIHKFYISYNGFYLKSFIKCFGMKIKDKYYRDLKVVRYNFTQHLFLDGSMRSSYPLVLFMHHPNYFLLSGQPKWFFVDRPRNKTYRSEIIVRGAEILERRNKAKEKCMIDGKYYDDLVLRRHIEDHECRAPYDMYIV